ncbi:MAG: rhamnogalacturonan acetylesterase [Myxococcota bacterium]
MIRLLRVSGALTILALGCGDTNAGADAAGTDAQVDVAPDAGRDVSLPIDASVDAAFDAPTDSAPLNCEATTSARGWDLCSATSEQCTVVFEDSTGCAAVCEALGLPCVEAYDNEDDRCAPMRSLPALGCGPTDHVSDYCVCGATSDAGVGDAGTDSAVDAGSCDTPIDVYLVGDSTVAPNSGWGDDLEALLNGRATVTNEGVGGASSKSFWDAGHFDDARDALGPGDYLLIQFGHNDSKPEAYRRTEPGDAPGYDDSYRAYLTRYLDAAEAAGATPILITSVSRMVFSGDEHRRTHGDYPAAMRRLAEDRGVVLLDLEQHSHEVFSSLGEDETLRLFAEEPDRTHFPPDKAFRVAEMVRDLLQTSASPLRCYVR